MTASLWFPLNQRETGQGGRGGGGHLRPSGEDEVVLLLVVLLLELLVDVLELDLI